MFKIQTIAEDRIDIQISGRVDAEQMSTGLDQLLSKSRFMQNGKMLYSITDLKFPTLGSLAVEITQLPKIFGLIKRFDKVAVLSDTGWLRKASELQGMFMPGLSIRAFNLDQQSGAEAWLLS